MTDTTAVVADGIREARRRPAGRKPLPLWRPPVSLGLLARTTNIDRSYLARIFNRKRKPSLAVARALASALNLTIEDLLVKLGY